jgi:hypothetical protein
MNDELSKKDKTTYQLTQEQLAEIYFSGSGDKPKQSELPLIIKVVEKPKLWTLAPWIIACAAFLLAAFSVFSSKRIFIDIQVVDDGRSWRSSQAADQESNAQPTASEPFEEESFLNKILPYKLFSFEGAAKLKSIKDDSGLTLTNSSVAPFARASLVFPKPISMSGTKITFSARGQRGGERLAFALKDRDNVLAFDKGKMFPFEKPLTNTWQKTEIVIAETSDGFDQLNVQSLRFEFGAKDTQNKPGDTIFIKDLKIEVI